MKVLADAAEQIRQDAYVFRSSFGIGPDLHLGDPADRAEYERLMTLADDLERLNETLAARATNGES